MKLAFKNRWSFGYSLKEVDIHINFGTLEAICKELEIDFNDMNKLSSSNDHDFRVSLLFQSYITACKERYEKPKYGYEKAVIWNEYMSESARKELSDKLLEFSGEITKMVGKEKSKKKVN